MKGNLERSRWSHSCKTGKKKIITFQLAANLTGWEHDNAKFDAQLERVVKDMRSGDGGREEAPEGRM